MQRNVSSTRQIVLALDIRKRTPEINKYEHNLKREIISIATKTRIVQTMLFLVTMYAYETLTTTKVDRQIQAFEMWYWRRILMIKQRTDNSISDITCNGSIKIDSSSIKTTFFSSHAM